jgi:hypothetical protein
MHVKFFNNVENETSTIKYKLKEYLKINWLYPSDEFGQMEKGVEYDSNTYINKR